MKVDKKILTRFDELIQKGKQVLETGRNLPSNYIGYDATVDLQIASQWQTSCLSILRTVFGENGIHYKRFYSLLSDETTYSPCVEGLGIIEAAKDDYENGYLFDTRALIEAEVFDDFLEQAKYLLNEGWFIASAVITGIVLEDALRKLCTKNGIILPAKPKLDTMNAELAKAGVYNLLKQKQITALADLRNKAAHGQGGFTKEDVEDMIRNVRRFMEDYFS